MYIYICTVSLAFSGNIELCTALCRAGAVPTTLDRSGYDPIHYANENGHLVCVKLLESFSNQKQEGAPASLVNNASPPSSVTSSSEWTRCLDHTGSSFYHNRETGESLWGDDYRNANGHGDHSTTADNPPPKYNESNDVDSDENAVFVSSSNKKIEPSAADQDVVTKVAEETTLAPITESLVESSSNEKIEPSSEQEPSRDAPPDDKLLRPEKDSHLEQIIEDAVETSSIEDDQPTVTELAEAKVLDDNIPSSPPVSSNTNINDVIDYSNGTNILARNQSFEERISSLHQKMETQLMHRLQNLEDKIAQQNLEASSKVEEKDTSNNVAEMTSKILRLQTEQGAKDLEILSLKQQVVRLETDIIKQEKTCMHVGVGDGNIHDDEELVAAKANYEQQLKNARKEITQLKDQVNEEKKTLNIVNEKLEQSQANCERAKQMAHDEKASRASMKELLEEAQKDKGNVDAAMTLSLQEELRRAEETVVQMKDQMQSIESKALEEKGSTRQELEILKLRIKELENELEVEAAHKTSLEKLKTQHKNELSRRKEELNIVNSELVTLRDQLREAKMARMEAVVARDDAVNESSLAQEKARAAQTKLQEMTDFVNKATKLKESNERLHVSLQDETEKRKKLHNTLEDLKGRIRVYVRVRPLSESEMKANYQVVMTKEDDRTCVMASDAATASDVRDWEFDKIFSGSADDGNTQEAIFKDTSLLITSAIDGFNVSNPCMFGEYMCIFHHLFPHKFLFYKQVCIFAYGQ